MNRNLSDRLDDAFALVARDVWASGLPPIGLVPYPPEFDVPEGDVYGELSFEGSAQRASIYLTLDKSAEENLVQVAERISDEVISYLSGCGAGNVWPDCPTHPNHPLRAALDDGRACWICPATLRAVARIGHLPPQRVVN